jgi:hypothetical protein
MVRATYKRNSEETAIWKSVSETNELADWRRWSRTRVRAGKRIGTTKDAAAIFDDLSLPEEKDDLVLPSRDINYARDTTNDCCDQHAREIRKKRRFGKAYQRPLNWMTGDDGHEHVFAMDTGRNPKAEVRREQNLVE